MAKNVNIETIQFKLQDFGKLKSVNGTFNKLNKSLSFNAKQLKESIKSITAYDKRSQRSVSTFNRQIAALKELQNNVAIGGKAYKAFGAEADRLRGKLEALTGTQKKGFLGGRLGAGTTAAIGGAGAYIGQSLGINPAISGLGAAGAAAGAANAGVGIISKAGAIGGLQGAAIGAGIAAIGGGAQFASESAQYAAEIQKLEIALKGVTKNQGDFVKGLDVISETSKRLNVPLKASTKQFTTLAASVLGSGGTIEDAEQVFTGVSNAIKATGGNAEDVQSAIRAMSQIFGKGKVSAEELQGQLGERLAGAVVKFAEANGSSLQKLQKDLRDGTVGLDQIMKFTAKLNEDFAETANKVADSSADAGQRFQTTMDRLKNAVGQILQPIGAEFQRVFGKIVEFITAAIEKFNEFMGIGLGNAIKKTEREIERLEKILDRPSNRRSNLSVNKQLKELRATLAALRGEQAADGEETGKTSGFDSDLSGAKSPLESFAESAFKFANQAEQAVVGAFKGMEDALVKFVTTGKLNFSDLARSIIADLTRMLVRAAIVKPLFSFLFPGLANGGVVSKGGLADPTFGTGVPSNPSSVFGSVNAKGNVFSAGNKISKFAYGGIVSRPTIFPMRNGAGLMGEAGPEGILPLKRGKDGKLGVIANGGGVGNIVVNVDASGTNVEGEQDQGRELGRLIAVAVQSEILEQQRPGGLLA